MGASVSQPRRSTLGILTDRGRAFLLTGIAAALVGYLFGWRDVLRIGLLLTALVVIVAVIYPRRRLGVRVGRELHPPRIPFGERATVQITFANESRRRTPLLLAQETLDYTLGNRPRFAVPGMPAGEERTLGYTITGGMRGRHLIGPVAVEQQDPFRLTRLRHSIGGTQQIVVLPRVVDLLDKRPSSAGTGTEGDVPLMLALHGEDDVSIRAYHDGDDLRRVHWPATAHRGEIMMRQEERPSQRRAVLVLDTRSSAHRGVAAASSLEWAVTAIASVARILADNGYLLFLVTAETAAQGRAAHAMDYDEILYHLALEPATSDAGYEHALEVAGRLTRDHGLVVLAAAHRRGQASLPGREIRARGGLALGFVIDTDSFEHRLDPAPAPGEQDGWHLVPVRAGDSHLDAWTRLLGGTRWREDAS